MVGGCTAGGPSSSGVLRCSGRKTSRVASKMSAPFVCLFGAALLLCLFIQFARNLRDHDDHPQKSLINRGAKHDEHDTR
jgi:hypothetical protein